MLLKHILLLTIFVAVAVASVKKPRKESSESDSSSSESCSDRYNPGEEPKTKYVCDEDVMHIACKHGYLIKIIWANYGRLHNDKCVRRGRGDTTTTNCTNSYSTQVVQYKCDDRQKCEVSATTGEFGEPCDGVYKMLNVLYQCIKIQKCYTKSERFTVNRNKCRETCTKPEGDVSVCGTEPGCCCTGGNVYDPNSDRCICRDLCPWRDVKYPKCKTHEHFESCATLCPISCEDRYPQKPCPLGCKPGYVCDAGFVRDTESGRCVRECDCPCCTQPAPRDPSSSSESSSGSSSSSESDSSDETLSLSSSDMTSSEEDCYKNLLPNQPPTHPPVVTTTIVTTKVVTTPVVTTPVVTTPTVTTPVVTTRTTPNVTTRTTPAVTTPAVTTTTLA